MKQQQNGKYISYTLRKPRSQQSLAYVPTHIPYIPNKPSYSANSGQLLNSYHPVESGNYSQLVRTPLLYKPALKVKACQLTSGNSVTREAAKESASGDSSGRWKCRIVDVEEKAAAASSGAETKKQMFMFRWFFDEFMSIRQNMKSALFRFKDQVSRFYRQTF